MRRNITLSCVVVSVFLFFISSARAEEPQTLRVLALKMKPFFYLDAEEQVAGFEYDLLRSFAASQGLELQIKWTKTGQELFAGLNRGAHDISAATLTITEERQEVLTFSRPYFPVIEVLVERRSQVSDRLEDLEGRKVAVWRGSRQESYLEKVGAELFYTRGEEVSPGEALLQAVAEGKAFAAAIDSPIYLLHAEDYPELTLSMSLGEPTYYGFALAKDNPLAAELDAHLEELMKRGEFRKFLREAFGDWAADALDEIAHSFFESTPE